MLVLKLEVLKTLKSDSRCVGMINASCPYVRCGLPVSAHSVNSSISVNLALHHDFDVTNASIVEVCAVLLSFGFLNTISIHLRQQSFHILRALRPIYHCLLSHGSAFLVPRAFWQDLIFHGASRPSQDSGGPRHTPDSGEILERDSC